MVALPDAAALEEPELQPEAQARGASPRREQPLQVALPELAPQESEVQPEVALVLPRAAQPQALPRQEALQTELVALPPLPSFA